MNIRTVSFLRVAAAVLLCLAVSYLSVDGAAAEHFFRAGVAFGQDTGGENKEPTADTFPAASIPERNFAFEPVVDGVKVLHDFLIRNEGGAVLHITRVKTG